MTLTLEEVQRDYEISTREEIALKQVIQGMNMFINADPRESRAYLHSYLFKWEGLLNQRNRLHEKICEKLKELSQ